MPVARIIISIFMAASQSCVLDRIPIELRDSAVLGSQIS